ncbi:MAG: hypothetical protein V7678_07690 [Brevundimonas sp.]
MARAIGLRVYQLKVTKRYQAVALPLDDTALTVGFGDFLSSFVAKNQTSNQHLQMERSWYFEPKPDKSLTGSRGLVRYGTFGFESALVDRKTKTTNYKRKVSDSEEIPLFYEIWMPSGADYALAAFQSFAGKSCISIVLQRLAEAFSKANSDHLVRIRKLVPTGSSGGAYASAPVKGLTLIRHDAPKSLTKKYLRDTPPGPIDFEVSIRAQRSGALGKLRDVSRKIRPDDKGVIVHEGVQFDEAVARIRVGSRTRPVKVLGVSTDAGIIDITDDVSFGADGHPTFASIKREAEDILKDFKVHLDNEK